MRKQEAVLVYGTSRIPYSIKRFPNRESIAVTVHPAGNVTVKAPKGTRSARIDSAVHSKASWIVQQQESFRQLQRGYPKKFVSGESFYYLGRQYQLKVRRSRAANAELGIRMFAGRLNVVVPGNIDRAVQPAIARRLVVDWYRKRAARFLGDACTQFAESVAIESPEVRIREMSSRWGSCSAAGWVAFNWRIIMAPRRLIEYVAAHEVCHLLQNDHSKDFWRLLENVLPDYETRRMELAITGAKFCI